MKRLRPEELAEQIRETQGEKLTSPALARLLDRSQGVWRELRSQKFSKNEAGHVTFRIEDLDSDYTQSAGDNVDGINVIFHDPHGGELKLGGIARIFEDRSEGRAFAMDASETPETIGSDDPRWDAIVGTIQQAVQECLTAKE